MKKLLLMALFSASVATASAQTPGSRTGSHAAAERAGSHTSASPSPSAITVVPNTSAGNGQRTGQKINTAPATGATRASRSSSTTKAARQGRATGSGNIEMSSKNSTTKPGVKK